jgi:hypothetical protein
MKGCVSPVRFPALVFQMEDEDSDVAELTAHIVTAYVTQKVSWLSGTCLR